MKNEDKEIRRQGDKEKRPRNSLLVSLSPCLLVCLFLAALVALGKAARDSLRHADRFTVAFADIDCRPSPPLPRGEFLAEVQYLAGTPDRLSVLDDGLGQRLADSFARHPWVKRVVRAEVVRPGRVSVHLEYRTPVMAVPLEGKLRAVDREGVLLPSNAATNGLPVFPGHAEPPKGPAGTRWGDAAVEHAARAAE